MPRRALGVMRLMLVLVLASSLLMSPGFVPPVHAEEGGAIIHGSIYQSNESEKLAGAKVTAVNVRTRKQYVSNVTGDNGEYEILGLPGGTYDIAIEAGGGIFVADNLIDLSPNQSLDVAYSVQPLRPANRKLAGMAPPQGSATPVGSFGGTGASGGSTFGGGRHFWTSPGGIVLLAVLAGGTGYAIEHNRGNNNASPSMP